MGKFLKNIAVFLKDMMGVLLLLWPSSYPVIPFLSFEDRVPNSSGLYLVARLTMRPAKQGFLVGKPIV